jgi:molybdopterin-guanine dinucleotide biosynthesis protein MobB
MPQIISIVGKSGSGKTTLLQGLIKGLKRRGLRVATIKHSSHAFMLDSPGKDTSLLAEAGSELVVFNSPQSLAYIRKVDKEVSLDELSQLVGEDFDIVLTEGYTKERCPKIEVHRSQQGTNLISPIEELIAIASDEPLNTNLPQYNLDDFGGLVELIEGRVRARRSETGDTEVTLFADGKSVPLNPFVKEIITRTLLGMASALKGVAKVTKLDISVRIKNNKEVSHQ